MLDRVVDFSIAGYAMRVLIGLLIVALVWHRRRSYVEPSAARVAHIGDRLRWHIAAEALRASFARNFVTLSHSEAEAIARRAALCDRWLGCGDVRCAKCGGPPMAC